MAYWSDLPYDIIHKVTTYLEAIEDFIAFSSVCRSWRLVYLTKQWNLSPQIPCLMLSDKDNNNLRSFYSLYRRKVCNAELPEASGRRCWGTSSEWLVTVGSDFQIYLLNAFTRVSISLPPKSSLQIQFGEVLNWYQLIDKALVIKRPSNSRTDEVDLIVIVIYGPLKQLAFCRPGYSSWVRIENNLNFHSRFSDVAYVKNQIFALCDLGTLMVIDIDGQHTPKISRLCLPSRRWACRQLFLVESSGDLYLVHQYHAHRRGESSVGPIRFILCIFDFIQRRWITVNNLGDHAIFLGDNCSMSVSAPNRLNCKSNSIYFIANKTDQSFTFREDSVECVVGVYDLAKGTSRPLCSVVSGTSENYSCPVWVIPTLPQGQNVLLQD